MKILVYCPTYANEMCAATKRSLKALDHGSHDVTIEIDKSNPYPTPDHRNTLAKYQQAREKALSGYDALMVVEHDMVIPEDALIKLAATKADVIYGLYMLRHGTKVCNALEWLGEDARNMGESLTLHPEKYEKAKKQVVARVSGVGFGCTLIHNRALAACEFHASGQAYAPDWGLAEDCNRLKFVQVMRFDVICGHVDGKEVLWPPL